MSSAQTALIFAVLVQVALTFVMYLMLVRARFAAAKNPATDLNRVAYDQSAWPVQARQISNSVMSQFEAPVLFYIGVLFAFEFGAADWITAILAWIFALSRIVHAFIHTGANVVMQRFGVFLVGFAALIVFWVYLAIHLLNAGVPS